jgi:hypothetical protein
MNPKLNPGIFQLPQTLLGRVAAGLVAATLVIAAFFFLFFVLILAGVVLLGFSLRAMWRARRARAEASKDIIDGEYSVEITDIRQIDTPPAGPSSRQQ